MKVKGTMLENLVGFVTDEYGPEALAMWLENMDDATRQIFESVFASAWYPFEAYERGAISACNRFAPEQMPETLRRLGARGADHQLTGIYRVIVHAGSPNMMLSAAAKTWRMFYSEGKVNVPVNDTGHAVIRLFGVPAKTTLWGEIGAGWLERGLEIVGQEAAKVVVTNVPKDGNRYFEYTLSWR